MRAQRLESIDTLASGIAHDLNNILTPILITAQLLQLKSPEPDKLALETLQTQKANTKRGAAIIKQVLSSARGVEGEAQSSSTEALAFGSSADCEINISPINRIGLLDDRLSQVVFRFTTHS